MPYWIPSSSAEFTLISVPSSETSLISTVCEEVSSSVHVTFPLNGLHRQVWWSSFSPETTEETKRNMKKSSTQCHLYDDVFIDSFLEKFTRTSHTKFFFGRRSILVRPLWDHLSCEIRWSEVRGCPLSLNKKTHSFIPCLFLLKFLSLFSIPNSVR